MAGLAERGLPRARAVVTGFVEADHFTARKAAEILDEIDEHEVALARLARDPLAPQRAGQLVVGEGRQVDQRELRVPLRAQLREGFEDLARELGELPGRESR